MRIVPNLCLVGWTYRHWPMRRLFEAAEDLGCPTVELRPCADTKLGTVEQILEALPRAEALAARHRVKVGVVYLHNFVVTKPSEIATRNRAFFSSEVLTRLSANGVGLVHMLVERVRPGGGHVLSSHEAEEADFAACRDGLEVLAETLSAYGLRAAVEIRPGTIADTFEGALWTSGLLDSETVGVSADFANLLLTDRDLSLTDAVRSMHDHMVYTHCKNIKLYPWGHDWDIPLSAGCIDYFAVLAAMRHVGYTGLIGLEYCGSGDPDAFLAQDVAYMKGLEQRLARDDRYQPRWTDQIA